MDTTAEPDAPRLAETYDEVEDALLSRWPETKLDPTLDRIESFLELLGDPQLNYPVTVKFDRAGNLYIGDGSALRVVSPAGIITTVMGTGAWGLAFDNAGNLFVADPSTNTVRLLKPVGSITQ